MKLLEIKKPYKMKYLCLDNKFKKKIRILDKNILNFKKLNEDTFCLQ